MLKKILITLSIFIILGLMWGAESTYTRQATITNTSDNIVTCTDESGHIWQYIGNGTIGDNITLVMYDNHTSNITDDIVKGVH